MDFKLHIFCLGRHREPYCPFPCETSSAEPAVGALQRRAAALTLGAKLSLGRGTSK